VNFASILTNDWREDVKKWRLSEKSSKNEQLSAKDRAVVIT
jgi:hypothetical protein